MAQVNIALVAIGGVVLLLSLVSGLAQRHPAPLPLLATAIGIALAPHGARLLHGSLWDYRSAAIEQAARLTLAIGLMGVALRLPPSFLKNQRRVIAVLLTVVMAAMWGASAVVLVLGLGLSWQAAILAGSVVTPTDPVVAGTIVSGPIAERCLPARLRNAISAESGANDGLAFPFVLFSIDFLTTSGHATIQSRFMDAVVREVGGGALCGGVAGLLAGNLVKRACARKTITESALLTSSIALSLALLGAAALIDANGFLAVFVGGVAFAQRLQPRDRDRLTLAQEAMNRFFILPIFVMLGLALPWSDWISLGWRLVLVAIGIIAVRRVPWVLMAKPLFGPDWRWSEALFIGWFGPIGVGAMYYGLFVFVRTGSTLPWNLATAVICASLIAHGLTGVPLTRRFRRSS